jgi:hypothetical protein
MQILVTKLNKYKALAVVATLAVPVVVLAKILPECGKIVNNVFTPCEYCHLFQLIENVINLIIIDIAVPLAAVAFAIAGYIYITAGGNSGKISQAHSIFKNVAIGLIIVLASWLVIDLVMKTLVADPNYLPWDNVQCVDKKVTLPV